MTEKLFYHDSCIDEFDAKVLSCDYKDGRYEAVLDRTAFFPEGGGQSADTGILKAKDIEIAVLDVQEKEGRIIHYITERLEQGDTVHGKLDFKERFSKMQQHTGEHIISGIVHSHFGYKNVGFHLGKEIVTMDYDGELSAEDIRLIEYEANEAVVKNLPIEVLYPTQEELQNISYRSKIEIEGQIRIVRIPGYDVCACCAPHVKHTGSIGVIKITGAIRYKGGMRLSMLCGFRALEDYRQKQDSVVKISNFLSVKQEQVADGVLRQVEEIQTLKEKVKRLQETYVKEQLEAVRRKAASQPNANLLLFLEELDPAACRNFVNEAMKWTKAVCGVFTGNEKEGFRYVLGSSSMDIREIGKRMDERFQGRGGGKPPMIQGSLKGAQEKIEKFLERQV